jgi:translation initiation factor 2B subunit (eIF-2B alpha/beta/delta family)
LPLDEAARATLNEITEDRWSGASEVARRAAGLVSKFPTTEVREVLETLLRARGSFASLWRLATYCLDAGTPAMGVARFLQELDDDARAGEKAQDVIGYSVLTLSWSSSVFEALKLRRPARVLCMRSDPGGEGALTAERLSAFCDAQVVEDDDALARIWVDTVLVGADAVTPTSVVNKVKTRALADRAKELGVPVYALAGETKFLSPGVVVSEGFEATPVDVFTGIITQSAVVGSTGVRTRAEAHRIHPTLLPLLDQ